MTKTNLNFFLLHGFLGHPEDWSPLLLKLKQFYKKAHFFTPHLSSSPHFGPQVPLTLWGEKFNRWVLSLDTKYNILIGYSMGGRLALHSLENNPNLWEKSFVISAHPGLDNKVDKESRNRMDQEWIQRLKTDPFEDVISQWNQQSVFEHTVENRITIDKVNPTESAEALNQWSLAHQRNFIPFLQHVENKICFICGQNDFKYSKLYSTLSISSQNKIFIKNCGHRVLQENPEELAQTIIRSL